MHRHNRANSHRNRIGQIIPSPHEYYEAADASYIAIRQTRALRKGKPRHAAKALSFRSTGEGDFNLVRFSVFIPTFRRPYRLWAALCSVAAQTHDDVETVVVNNAGPSVEHLVDRYRVEFGRPVRLISVDRPLPISAVRNVAASASSGDAIALLDDDDRFHASHLARLDAALAAHPQAPVAYAAGIIELEETSTAEDRPRVTATCEMGIPYDAATFLQNNYILTSAIGVRRKAFEAVGGFDPGLRVMDDWDFLLRVRSQGDFAFVPHVGLFYSQRSGNTDNHSLSNQSLKLQELEVLRQRHNMPDPKAKTFLDVARELGCSIVAH